MRSKNYRAIAEQIDEDATYSPLQAMRLAKSSAKTKRSA